MVYGSHHQFKVLAGEVGWKTIESFPNLELSSENVEMSVFGNVPGIWGLGRKSQIFL